MSVSVALVDGTAVRRCAELVIKAWNIHIDGCEATVGDGAADGTGKGESGVETDTAELGSRSNGVNDVGLSGLKGADGGSHCECVGDAIKLRSANNNRKWTERRGGSFKNEVRGVLRG
jgi:hypothetical protein